MWMPSWPTMPEIDEMFTIEPPPARRMAGMAVFMPRKTPLAFTFMRASQPRRVHGIGGDAAADARVVDEDVELAEGARGLGHRRLPFPLAGDVEARELRLAARPGDLLDDLAPVGLEHVGHDDGGALAREHHRLAPPHAAGPAGDDGYLACESHGRPPLARRLSTNRGPGGVELQRAPSAVADDRRRAVAIAAVLRSDRGGRSPSEGERASAATAAVLSMSGGPGVASAAA